MKNIILIGMPAVGKSTVGHLLARRLNYEFLDSDDVIQAMEGRTLAQIISEKGLDGFLHVEEKHLMGIECEKHVIATGGSVVYSQKAMEHLAKTGTILYLSVGLDQLLTRLSDITSRGVAISPGKNIEDLYKERTPLYDRHCHVKIECGSMTPEQVVERAIKDVLI